MAELPRPENTVTFSRPASKSIFSTLPAELATYIFDLATLNCRPNAANCRLVCQYFYTYSSLFLVRTIVIASRLNALRKAREVLLHPYFREHVTHLLWDASFYDYSIAGDFRAYAAEFVEAPYTPDCRDDDFRRARRADDLLEDQLRCGDLHVPSVPAELRGGGSLLDYGISASAGNQRDGPQSRQPQQDGSEGDLPEYPDTDHYGDCIERNEIALMKACHLTWPNYVRGWLTERQICSSKNNAEPTKPGECGLDGNLCRHYFLRAIHELPRLNHISYADYRSLAYEGESYTGLARRLFGHMVCPNFDYSHDRYSHDQESSTLPCFLEDLAECGRPWQSLSIGQSPFERSPVDQAPHFWRGFITEQMEMSMGYQYLQINSSTKESAKLQVQSLRLPLIVDHAVFWVEPAGSIASFVQQDRLVELDLGTDSFDGFVRGKPNPQEYDPMLRLLTYDLKNLQSISLRGFAFSVATIKEFLSDHTAALRSLRLINCFCSDSYATFEAFATEYVAPSIALTGIEIYGLQFSESSVQHEAGLADEYTRYRALRYPVCSPSHDGHSMRNCDLQALEERSRQEQVNMVAGWPYERFELEAAMLGGRVNSIVRRRQSPPSEEARKKWWDLPASYR